MAQEPIWAGSSSFSSGDTPWGLYDTDNEFTSSADKFADWSARRLGYPIMSVELQSGSFYACFEEAVTEYSAQVNQFNIRENLLSLRGQATGSNVTHKRVTPNFADAIRVSEQYGTEAGVGGTIDFKSGSISVSSGSQVYDLNSLWAAVSESGNAIEIRKVYYEASPAVQRYFDPYAGTGAGSIQSYMSPYQQSVIDATLSEYDIQAQKGQHGIMDAASRIGALGAGRTGVQLGEYQAN